MRSPRRSVAFRILAGLTVIGGLAAATSVVAVSLFSRFHQGYEQIATAKVPGLVAAAQLVQQSGAVAAIAPALVAAQDQTAREAVMARMGDQIVRLEQLMARLIAHGGQGSGSQGSGSQANGGQGNGGQADLGELDRRKNELVGTLLTLNAQVRQQLALTAETNARAQALAALTGRLGAAESREEEAPWPMETRSGLPDAEAAERSRDALERWRRDLTAAATTLLAALRADRDGQLDGFQAETRMALDNAAAALALLPPDRAARLQPLQREVEEAAFGRSPLFTLRAAELSLQRAVKRSAARNQAVSDQLVGIVSDYFLAVEQDVAHRSSEFERVIRDGERAVVAMALLSILGAAAIFAYIHRNVVARLRRLRSAMQAVETAEPAAMPDLDLPPATPSGSRDEIGEMARAGLFRHHHPRPRKRTGRRRAAAAHHSGTEPGRRLHRPHRRDRRLRQRPRRRAGRPAAGRVHRQPPRAGPAGRQHQPGRSGAVPGAGGGGRGRRRGGARRGGRGRPAGRQPGLGPADAPAHQLRR